MRHASIRQERLSAWRLLVYALATTGGIIGYTPLLALLLPIKLAAFPEGERYALLAVCSVAGALTAGVANIGFGALGDRAVARGGGRRGWMVAGLVATIASFVGVAAARQGVAIVLSIVAFQVAVNALLAQVSALVADEVPAAQKNTATALLTLGNPLAAAASALVVAAAIDEAARLALVAVLMAGCVVPLLLVRMPTVVVADTVAPPRTGTQRDLAVAWGTRLLVQVANSGVALLLFFYFARLVGPHDDTPAIVARLLLLATVVPVPLALLLGRWCDRAGRREWFLAGTASVATLALFGMALAGHSGAAWTVAAAWFVVFASGVTAFQALNTGHAMLLLPAGAGTGRAGTGRDLGWLNLANTLPQVIAPLLAWSVTARSTDLTATLSLFSLLTLAAALLPLATTWRAQSG